MSALQAKAGDSIEYQNTANEPFQAKIVAFLDTSILQGNLVIAETDFIEQFPDSGGYRFFLLDCTDPELAKEIAQSLSEKQMREIYQDGLHEFLADFIGRNNQFAFELSKDYNFS